MDFIIIGLQPWDIEIGSNCKNIALELSKEHRVLYVNNPLDRKSALARSNSPDFVKRKKIMEQAEDGLMKVQDNLWTYYPSCIAESINWIRPHFLFRWFNYMNNKRFAKDIKKAIRKLKFDNYTLFNDNSIFLGYHQKDLLEPNAYIYYIRDNLSKNNYWGFHGSKLEPKLIAKADLVVTNSIYYQNYAKPYNRASFMIGQGCDFTLYNQKPSVPEELTHIARPIIGYVGYLSSRRLSISLINELATANKNWSFVFVGPEDESFQNASLHELENVHFLGKRNENELVNYVANFDVCINPQFLNDATIGNYPRKIDEYLYVGKPTVATSTEAMTYFEDYVFLAEDAVEYQECIRKALGSDSESLKEKRKNFASLHTWEKSVKLLLSYLSNEHKRKNK